LAAFPFYPQQDPDDCGVMVLQMLCSYYGLDIGDGSLRQIINVPYGEISLLSLSKAAEALGFETVPFYISLQELGQKVRLPAIVHIQGNHYAILYKWNEKYVWLADPARGKYRLTQEEFRVLWLVNNRGVVLQLSLPQSHSIKLPEGIVNETSSPQFLWRPQLTVSSFFQIGFTLVALFLLLQWLGVLFNAIATQQTGIAFPIVMGISFLLLGAIYLLERYGNLWAEAETCRLLPHQNQRNITIFPESLEERLSRIKIEQVYKLRITAMCQALLKMPVIMGVIGYLAWQAFPIATGLLVLTICHIGYLIGTEKAWLGNWYIRFTGLVFTTPAIDNPLRDHSMTMDTQINALNKKSLYPDGGILFLGFITAACLIVYAWVEKVDAATFLVLLVAASFWLRALSVVASGVRAWHLRYFGVIENENHKKVEEINIPTRSGNIQYNLNIGHGEWRELLIPSGKSTFILGKPSHFRSKVLEWLLAMEIDEGGRLLVGDIEIGKQQRLSLWKKISGLWGEKAFGKHMKDAKMTYPDTTLSQEWFGIFRKDNEIDEYVGKHVEGNYDMDSPDQKNWQFLLTQCIQADPDIFVLNKPFDDMEPFTRFILLENIVTERKGKTTIIATAGNESAMVADWIIYIQGDIILDQGTPSEVIQRQGLL
jgi:ABC-type cobalamin/Fe3+-siderophores transport system ATPase subunit